MLLTDETNIREVILFPMNGRAEDLLMQAPNVVSQKHLKDLYIKTNFPKEPGIKHSDVKSEIPDS